MNVNNNNKYIDNYVSFTYPIEYNINPIIGINGRFLEGKKDSENTFEISKKMIDLKFDDEVKARRDLIKENWVVHEERSVMIDGVRGYQICYSHPLIGYNEYTFFDKNEVRYVILISDPNLDVILKSFKVINVKCDCGYRNKDSSVFCQECGNKLKKSNKSILIKTVNELNHYAIDYGVSVTKNGIYSNWIHEKQIEVYFGKDSAFKTVNEENFIIPPDIISIKDIDMLLMSDNEYNGNLKTEIFLKRIMDDSIEDIGTIILKIYDIDIKETDNEITLSFICDFD